METVMSNPGKSIVRAAGKSLGSMHLKELLVSLAEDTSRYETLRPHIVMQELVQRALMASTSWVAINNDDRIDAEATFHQLTLLANGQYGHLPQGYRLTTFEDVQSLGRPLLNPFAKSIEDVVTLHPIAGEYWLQQLPTERHLAYIWAAFLANHSHWPSQPDTVRDLDEAFAPELRHMCRWDVILKHYRECVAANHYTTQGLTRYASMSGVPAGPPISWENWWYIAQLTAAAEERNDIFYDNFTTNGPVLSWATMRDGVLIPRPYEAIALGDIHITGGIQGRIFVSLEATVTGEEHVGTGNIERHDWEALYYNALGRRLIQPSYPWTYPSR